MVIPPWGFSIPEFRALHGYGEGTYKALQKAGLGPRETLMPGTLFQRITADDYAAWLKQISDDDCQLKEFLRRREMQQAWGRKAAKSPGHTAQMWKKWHAEQAATASPKAKPRPPKVAGRRQGDRASLWRRRSDYKRTPNGPGQRVRWENHLCVMEMADGTHRRDTYNPNAALPLVQNLGGWGNPLPHPARAALGKVFQSAPDTLDIGVATALLAAI